jgi:hypothetical protein
MQNKNLRLASLATLGLLASSGLAASKWRAAWLATGALPGGEALTDPAQVVPYSVAMAWRSLAVGLGAGAAVGLGCLAVCVVLRRHRQPIFATPGTSAPIPMPLVATVAALTGLAYGFLHRWLGPVPPMGDEASYLGRGQELALALATFDFTGVAEWWSLTGHRPWPGLLPAYAGAVAGVPLPVLVGLQAGSAWALAAVGVARVGRVLGVRAAAVAITAALLVTQPLWRAESTAAMADAMLTGTLLIAFAELFAFLRAPDGAACLRAGLAIALPVACKPAGNLWSVAALGLGAAVWLLLVDRRDRWQVRAAWLAELGAIAAVGATTVALAAGGPKTWAMIERHAMAIEGLGYYDEALAGTGDKLAWLAGIAPRLATVPLLAAALAGTWLTRGPTRVVAWVAVAVPLMVHGLAMESKSVRLVGAALAGLLVLALPACDALVLRVRWQKTPWVALACAIGLVPILRDLLTRAPDLQTRGLAGPMRAGDWRDVPVTWIGHHPVTDFWAKWREPAQAARRAVDQHCDRAVSTTLFYERRLIADPTQSGYAAGLTARDFYAPDTQKLDPRPLVAARACLVVHTGGALYWPGGHGRASGEAVVAHLAALVQDPKEPLAAAYRSVARIPLPDGHALVVYRRDHAADPGEQAVWADRVARWMPVAGAWAEFWRDTAERLAAANGDRALVCRNLQRAALSRPLRGVVRCERVDVDLCAAAALPAHAARLRAKKLACLAAHDNELWPAGVPQWQRAAALPRIARDFP